ASQNRPARQAPRIPRLCWSRSPHGACARVDRAQTQNPPSQPSKRAGGSSEWNRFSARIESRLGRLLGPGEERTMTTVVTYRVLLREAKDGTDTRSSAPTGASRSRPQKAVRT